jgi:hypothetical protein
MPRFVGGMRWRGANASWPFAELVVSPNDVLVRLRSPWLRRLLGRWLPSVLVPWNEVEAVQTIRGGLPLPFNVGLRILGRGDQNRGVVFWCGSRTQCRQILDVFKGHRTPINDGGTVW